MRPFTVVAAIAAPLPRMNVDTDQIIPARFMRKPWSDGYGKYLFHDLRFRSDGAEEPTFVLNQPAFRSAAILVAGENFGCGSSREPAVWALADFGIRAVVAPSFADIFYSNCLKNGILPLRLRAEDVTSLSTVLAAGPTTLHVDLPAQRLSGGGHDLAFEIEPFRKAALIAGLDEISMTLKRDAESIAAYVEAHRERAPWVFVPSGCSSIVKTEPERT